MDDLVANLVGGAAPSPMGANIDSNERAGAGALRDQLRAAENDMDESKIVMAAIGAARIEKSADLGQTLFLVAYNVASRKSAPLKSSQNISHMSKSFGPDGAPTSLSIVEEGGESPGFAMMDFNSLDEAFGVPTVKSDKEGAINVGTVGIQEAGGLQGERDEPKVELVEVKIDFLAIGGPRKCFLVLNTFS